MSGHPWRGILKPDRGYVCLSCLLKQHGVRPRRSLRYHSTATQSVTSSITDSGFAVEGGALRNLKGKPSDGVLLPNANAAPQPPKREEPAKEGAKRGKGGRKNAGSNLTEKKADGQTKEPKKADGQTKKPEKGRKGPRRAPGARKGTPNATKGTEQIADVGEASLIEKVEAPDTTDSDAVRGRQIGRRVLSRHEQVKSSKPLIRPKVSTLSIRKCSNRLVRDLSKPLIRKHESDDNFVHKVRRDGKTILVGPLQRREALKDLDNISILEEKDEDETSSTLHAASGPRKLSRNVAGIIRGKTSIAKAAELLERAREERLKLKGQGLAAQQKKSTLLTSLKSSLDAQKEALKVKDKAKKVIETKAKGRTKVPKAEKDGESKKSKPKKTVRSCIDSVTYLI